MRRENELKATPAPLPGIPAPRFAGGWAALVYVLATLALAYPALGGAFLVAPHSDQFIAGYSFREFAAASLRAGEGFPQWNSYLFGGMPYIAAMHGDIFYPTFLLRMILPTDVAMTWGFIIHLFLAGFFTYGFLRAWGLGFYAALIGGLGYMLSGPIAGYASPGHDGKLFVSALLPLSLWILVRMVRDGRRWTFGAFALVCGLAFLSPHPQLFQYFLLASGAFTLYLALHTPASGHRLQRMVALKRVGLALGGVLLGVMMGAVQYLPSLFTYEKWSPRAGGAGWEHAISYSMPVEELFNAIVPEFSGILRNYWGVNGIHFHSEYAGVVVLVLAGAGMFAKGVGSFRWFWIGTFVVSLLWALGGNTPFYRLIYEVVPYTKYLRAPSTMMFLSMFSLAVLAGVGVERVLAERPSKVFFFGWAGAIVLLGLIFAAGLPLNLAESLANRMSGIWPTELTTRVLDRARDNQPAVILGSLRSVFFVIATLAVIWFTSAGRLPRRSAAWILAGLVALDLWVIERRYWIFSPPARVSFATDPAFEAVKQASEPGRVLTWDPFQRVRDPAFYDAAMVHRVRLADGYHGNEIGRYQQLFASESAKSVIGVPLSPQFLRHANVHYLYTTFPDSLMSQLQVPHQWATPATKVVGPVRNAAGNDVYLYRLPGANPAAWIASAIVKAPDQIALMIMLDPRFDPLRAVVMDTAAAVQGVELQTAPPPIGVQARVTHHNPGAIDIQLDKPAPAGAGLVVSENYYPGWSATADGKEAVAARANFNLIGVALPTGAQRVELRFKDTAYPKGKTITLVVLALSLIALIGGVVLDRRQPVPAAA
jgi:hypothetical protein